MKKRQRIRKNKDGLVSPRKLLNTGHWRQLSFDEKVFTALTWMGFSNLEAWEIINPMSEASVNSRAVMAGRYACSPNVKTYIGVLNEALADGLLGFKSQDFKIGERQAEDAVDKLRADAYND